MRNSLRTGFGRKIDKTLTVNYIQIEHGMYTLLNNITEILNDMCSLRSFKINQAKCPWITPELLELIKDKDHAMKRAKRTRHPDD